jgi:uncharacterized protein (DUF983 family)
VRGFFWALRLRCPECGSRGVFERWGQLASACPGCGYSFQREEGYWVGAVIVNLGLAQILFMVLLIGGIAVTYPDVPWTPLLAVSVGVILLLPVWFYPRSKTLWVWLDRSVHPYDRGEWRSDD